MEEFKAGWKPLIASILGTACGITAITLYTQGLFIGPVTTELGWTETQFFYGFTVLMLAGLLTAPITGNLADKFGARTIGIIGLIGHAAGYVLISFNTGSVLLWCLSFFLLAVFAAGSIPLTWTGIVNSWFESHRGLAIGLTMAGSGLMAFIAPNVTEFFISEMGWRWAYRALGIGALLLSLPLVLLWLKPGRAKQNKESLFSGWGISRREAMRSYKFWVLGMGLFFLALTMSGLISNFVPILVDSGISRMDAASIASLAGLTIIIARLLVGHLLDRFWAPGIAAITVLLPITSLVLLATLPITRGVGIAAAITIGFAAGATLDLLAYLTSRYFGTLHYGSIFGAMFAFFTVAAGLAPLIFAKSYAFAGSYTPILFASVMILMTSALLFLLLGKYPEREPVS